eukprot:TRINITY_DN2840_c0_g1_i2.p1 TRINITY_DN2840_c0_g1~~TRINITY_DN2840_c0_g1_i2.p1  ORF type:complete len:121 (-),score=23.30 TRINITY_DN2840_c0_g1_i2:93-455(-)
MSDKKRPREEVDVTSSSTSISGAAMSGHGGVFARGKLQVRGEVICSLEPQSPILAMHGDVKNELGSVIACVEQLQYEANKKMTELLKAEMGEDPSSVDDGIPLISLSPCMHFHAHTITCG